MTPSPDRELHPIAQTVLGHLETTDGVSYELSRLGVEQVSRALMALFKSPELRPAVVTLISMAKGLEDNGSVKAADQLLRIAGTSTKALQSLGASAAKLAEDLGELTKARFAAFSGTSVARAAPKQGAAAEPGTVTVAALHAHKPRRA